jgi:phosphoglycerate dehydrogenase-like enzyme
MAEAFKLAILDDYQCVASSFANWGSVDVLDVTPIQNHISDPTELVRVLMEFDAVLLMRERTEFPASVIARLPNLKLLVTTGMKNASVDVAAARQRGIIVCGTRSSPVPPAELTWALVLALLRDIPDQVNHARQGRWQTSVGATASGRRLGLLGLGRIGTIVARFGQAFDMDVVAWSPNLTPERAASVGVTAVSKAELFSGSDIVSVHIRAVESTRGIVGPAEIAAMKSTAYLVNTSRAELVDEGALVSALSSGSIAGAGIDVFTREPADKADPLISLPNVIPTPHLGYVTQGNYRTFYEDALECVARYLAGDPVRVIE